MLDEQCTTRVSKEMHLWWVLFGIETCPLQDENEADGNTGSEREEACQVESLEVGTSTVATGARGRARRAAFTQAGIDGDAGAGRAGTGSRCSSG